MSAQTWTGGAFPNSLPLGGWWEADFAASPWVGQNSSGGSGGRNLAEATNPPNTGAIGGRTGANFDGTNDRLVSANNLSTFIAAAAYSVEIVFSADTAPAASSPNGRLLSHGPSTAWGVDFNTNGIVVYHNDSGGVKTTTKACATGGIHHASIWYDGTNVNVVVDGGTAATTAAGSISGLSSVMRVGNDSTSLFYDGRIAALLMAPSNLGPTARTNLRTYLQARYTGL